MRAAYYEQFKSPIRIETLPDPIPGEDEVIIRVRATGICRSDWHGWQGHDSDVQLPHVPGHELAGTIEAVGSGIRNWKIGDRVTVPFCVGCGNCPQCSNGQEQICDNYFQPGFTGWGSFAEFVKIKYADHNLVRLPDSIDYSTAAVLGCRFITSWRGVTAQGNIKPGEWVAVHGCGGVGLSAIMITAAFGAYPIAIDIDDAKLKFAESIGAVKTINASKSINVVDEIKSIAKGGARLSIDALGSRETCRNSILCLKKQGRHVQLGLLAGSEANPPLPMSAVIANELEIVGSHGMQAHQYPPMLEMITSGKIQPQKLLGKIVSLEEGIGELMNLNSFKNIGVTVIGFP
jgi:alcohol dehydrogenase